METPAAHWSAVINTIMERDGVTEEEANANLVALLNSPEVQAQIAQTEASAAEVVGNVPVTVAETADRLTSLEERVAALEAK